MGLASFNRARRLQAERRAAEEIVEGTNYDLLSFNELRKIAKDKGINSRGLKREALVEEIEKS